MEPSPEAIAWGKRQADTSPRWSDTKWNKIAVIFGVELTTGSHQHTDHHDHHDQEQAATLRDAA